MRHAGLLFPCALLVDGFAVGKVVLLFSFEGVVGCTVRTGSCGFC